jgi:hypothetical protein
MLASLVNRQVITKADYVEADNHSANSLSFCYIFILRQSS